MGTGHCHTLLPLSLSKEGDEGLVIEWNDGHRSIYTWQHLRSHCPCASCREEHSKPADPFRILTAKEMQDHGPLRPVAMTPMGHYAYKFAWNDGHDTGIYTLENLRELCQCPDCQRKQPKAT